MKAEDWVKVEDRLPDEDGQLCVIIAKSNMFYLARWDEHHRVFFLIEKDLGYYKGALTYWMPIVLPKEV